MNRRKFIEHVSTGSSALAAAAVIGGGATAEPLVAKQLTHGPARLSADLIVAGGGLGGCACALAALRNGLSVVLTEETDWLGGQLSQQGVPPDEHPWIETHGATQLYRDLRSHIREYYKRNYPLTSQAMARGNLNPGDGSVSKLCHEPKVAVAVLTDLFAPYLSNGKLTLLLEHKITGARAYPDKVDTLEATSMRSRAKLTLSAPYFVDATELGDLLPLTGTEFVTGAEAKSQTQELHASQTARPENNQAFTACFAIDYVPGGNHVIEKPREYDFWKSLVPKMTDPWSGRLLDLSYSNPKTLQPKTLGFHPEGIPTGEKLNLWNYRRIINKENFVKGAYPGDITVVNWPQNDYFLGNLVGASEQDFKKHFERAKQLSLSLLYWLQTEAPRPDGGKGWPGIRLRKDIMGTEDGLAKYPYIRESRRIKAVFTIKEEHVGAENRAMITGKKDGNKAAPFYDSVGIGYYHIDLHPSTGGDNYIDFDSLPFQIPLGALLPRKMENLLPANKNIGTTHITNGCYRLHPVEWNIGESVGLLVKYALDKKVRPKMVREKRELLAEFQDFLRSNGIATHWPE